MAEKNHWQECLKKLGKAAQAQEQAEKAAEAARRRTAAQTVDFAAAVGKVTPVKNSNRRVIEAERSPIVPRRQGDERDHTHDVFVGTGNADTEPPPTQYAEGGGGKNDIRRLLAAKHEIVATLDLHGYAQEEAQVVLNEFIDYVQARGVIGEIIHGSGLGSRGFVPTLKNLVRRWLIAHPAVLAYAEPPHNDGTVWILLKRRQRKRDA